MIIIIVGMTKSGLIGKDNALPWRIPEDLQNFKRLTSGNTIVMGRKTYESIGKPLPNRNNIVISRTMPVQDGITVCRTINEGLEKAKEFGKDIFIIGGATIYEQTLSIADKMYISYIKNDYHGDTYFPKFNKEDWVMESRKDYPEFEFIVYRRKCFCLNDLTKMNNLTETDPEVSAIIKKEEDKQQHKLSMIPSENFFSKSVREAVGSVLMHKYSEGNIGKGYYEGNQFIDEMESLAIERAKKVFKLPGDWSVNVQALAGSNANLAVYLALLNIGDTIMGMYLPDGGHLSHGWSYEPKKSQDPNKLIYLGGSRKVNITSKIFRTVQYKTSPLTQQFDYDQVEQIATLHKPKLIITGGTAYPREIDYQRMKQIADKVGAFYMADIAHEAGLIAAGVNKSPVGIADVITLTTHKTLRSARGALILAHQDLIKKIDRSILPGLQGGPFNHSIAGICVGLGEALKPEFCNYAEQVVKNAQFLCSALVKYGFQIVSGGTDKHLVLINLNNKHLLGKKFARALDYAGIIANMNTMPQEMRSPANPSALRLGTPWVTTRGMKEPEMGLIAGWINQVIEICSVWKDLEFAEFEGSVRNSEEIAKIADEVKELCLKFPLKV